MAATLCYLGAGLFGVIALQALLEREFKVGLPIAAIAAVLIYTGVHMQTQPKWSSGSSSRGDCYTDWDGRSNPTRCD